MRIVPGRAPRAHGNRPAEAGRFVRPAGADVALGAVALPRGTEVDPGAIGLCAALGRTEVAVHRRPRVGLLTTGDEIVPVDRTPLSTRKEIADATEAEASEGLIKFLRDHGTGSVPEHYYDRYVQESADHLRSSERQLETARA